MATTAADACAALHGFTYASTRAGMLSPGSMFGPLSRQANTRSRCLDFSHHLSFRSVGVTVLAATGNYLSRKRACDLCDCREGLLGSPSSLIGLPVDQRLRRGKWAVIRLSKTNPATELRRTAHLCVAPPRQKRVTAATRPPWLTSAGVRLCKTLVVNYTTTLQRQDLQRCWRSRSIS